MSEREIISIFVEAKKELKDCFIFGDFLDYRGGEWLRFFRQRVESFKGDGLFKKPKTGL